MEIILLRGSPVRVASSSAIIRAEQNQTVAVDLSLPIPELLQRMRKDCRSTVQRGETLRERIQLRINETAARNDFLNLYNRFVEQKSFGARPLTAARMKRIDRIGGIFVIYADGKPLAAQLVLRDEDERRANSVIAISARLDHDADLRLLGVATRYLDWQLMCLYKRAGFTTYDFCGFDIENLPSVSRFKLSFGGDVLTVYDYVIAGLAARPAVKIRELARGMLHRVGFEPRVWQI
jgi:hypothetical protein